MSTHESNVIYEPVTIGSEEIIDLKETARDKAIVDGGMPIYIQGGKRGKLKTGGAVDYMIDDININLELVDRVKLTDTADNDKLGQVLYTFRVSNITELDDWLNSSPHDFVAKCLRKFKIHMPYSNSLKGLFFDIVKLFEGYVMRVIEKAGLDRNKKISEFNAYDNDNNIESSSVILYQFGRDEELNTWLEKHSPNLYSYINDNDRWSYKGWCPHVPDIRFRHLLEFPLELVILLLSDDLDFAALGDDFAALKKLTAPPINDDHYLTKFDSKKPVGEKVDALATRIKLHRVVLKEWESYYVKCSEQVLDQVIIFQKHFPLFGK